MAVKRIIDLPTDHNPSASDYIAIDGATTRGTQLQDLIKPIPAFVGDSGSGGTKGLVPAPATGDAAAGKVLGSGGGWVLPPSAGALGQCRLVKSGANIVLQPFNGNLLAINGTNQTIPAAGVSLAPTGLTPSTAYFIYAYMNSGTMTLEASTTAHSTDASSGVEIKSGDATRTLVGWARPITGPAFADSATQRLVLSWFNQRDLQLLGAFTTGRSTSSASYAEVNTEIRVEFGCWGTSAVKATFAGNWQSSSGVALNYAGIAFDGVTPGGGVIQSSTNLSLPASLSRAADLAEGYHYATLTAKVSASTILFAGGTDGSVLQVVMRG